MLINLIFLSILQFFILFVLSKFAYKVNLLDYPSKRKIHSKPTPYIGGLALGLCYCLIIYIAKIEYSLINLILLYSLIVSLVGFVDDKFDISPIFKLLLQSIPVYLLISEGLYLSDIGEYEVIGIINLGYFSKIFTFLCCLLIINSFNYSDGIDGLLSSLFINIFFSFAFICLIYEKTFIIYSFIYIIIPVFVFFLFNVSFLKLPKIFLGDSGSTLLGFITGFVMIFLYSILLIEPSILIWPVALVIYDFLGTNLVRILKKKNLFQSGDDHFHYQISKKYNFETSEINLIMNLINLFITLTGFAIYYFFGSLFSLIGFVLIFFIFLYFKIYFLNLNKL